ncbi:MAG: TetR/AcrR family transcriptional regulator [Sphingomonadales bacterium]|nr:TetR/AcrR family transcriptional regulator [Sphingomonadales bacterium]
MTDKARSELPAEARAPSLYPVPAAKPARPPGRGRGRPSRETIELRNQELLEHALDLFLEHGFEATTIEAISGALGMSRRTIYARYADKETLFRAALQLAIDQWIIPVGQLRELECDDLEETLLRIARLWVANVRKPSGLRLVRIAYTEVFRRPEVAATMLDQTTQVTIGYIAELFRRRLRPGKPVPDAVQAATAFINLVIEGSVQLAVWDRTMAADLDRQIAYNVRLFLRGALHPAD